MRGRGQALIIGIATLSWGGFATASAPPDEVADTAAGETSEATTDAAPDYDDPASWICLPGRDDVCASGLDTTEILADGTAQVIPFTPNADAPIDCFYVYPTVSLDPGANSDLEAGDEERFVVADQAAPFGDLCRVFAPLYRQVTLAGLSSRLAGDTDESGPDPWTMAYDDVTAAWDHYLTNDNQGRGVVLIGHSQGAGILRQLLADRFDDDPAMSQQLVSAILAGTGVQVAPGSDRGGDFDNLPLCRADEQVGCVVTWVTYRASSPPPDNAIFGNDGDGTVAACTNPAALAGGRVPLSPRLPSDPSASILANYGTSAEGTVWAEGVDVATPWVDLPGVVTGACVRWDDKSWLEVAPTLEAGPRIDDIGGDLTPEWGLHLVDINVVLGDLHRLVTAQSAAWLAANAA